jgi:hypothetical protein
MVDATIVKEYNVIVNFNPLYPDGIVGVWVAPFSYEAKKHWVRGTGGSFICTADHTSSSLTEPGVGANWETVWLKYVQDGAAGETGCAANITANSFVRGDTGSKDVKGSTQTLSDAGAIGGGFSYTIYDAGAKSSGTFTPDPVNGNIQKCVNGGAFTLAPPTNDTAIILKITNNSSAGAITTSGFTKVNGSFTTTNGHKFECSIRKLDGDSILSITRFQ